MVRQANHWAMGYGDVCLSSLWASYNVIKQNASVVLSSATWYFFVLWATPNGKLLAGLGKSQDISEYTEHWSKKRPKLPASRKQIKHVWCTISIIYFLIRLYTLYKEQQPFKRQGLLKVYWRTKQGGERGRKNPVASKQTHNQPNKQTNTCTNHWFMYLEALFSFSFQSLAFCTISRNIENITSNTI